VCVDRKSDAVYDSCILDIDGVLNQLQGNFFLDAECVKNPRDLRFRLHTYIHCTGIFMEKRFL